MRSRTCFANSGEREATTYSYLVFCAVIPRVLNCASTWANHTSGSDGQNEGSLRFTAAIVLGLAACVSSATDIAAAYSS